MDSNTVELLKSKNGATAVGDAVVVERSIEKREILTEKHLARSIVIIFFAKCE